jgi:hypothetical protein
VGAGIAYGVQVYANYQSGKTGWAAWTSNIDGGTAVAGANAAALYVGYGVAPAVVGAAAAETWPV